MIRLRQGRRFRKLGARSTGIGRGRYISAGIDYEAWRIGQSGTSRLGRMTTRTKQGRRMSDFSITLKRLLGMDRGGVIRAYQGRFNEFLSVRDAAAHVKATAQPGEVILLKGSNNLHLERIAIAMQSDVKWRKRIIGLQYQ